MLGSGRGVSESFRIFVQGLISSCLDPQFFSSLSTKDSTLTAPSVLCSLH